MASEVDIIMDVARLSPKGSWRTYSFLMCKLHRIPLPPDQFRDAQQYLLQILEV